MQNLNSKQKEAVEYMGGPLLIVAGAGSGKTKTLTSRVAYLLKQGINPENIIAITFTNKAADEMRKRVNLLVGDLVNWEKDKLTNQLINQKLFVGTFHSLGARILKKEGRLLGRTINFTIFDDDDSKTLIKKILANYNLPEKEKKRLSVSYLAKEFGRIKDELSDVEDIGDEWARELFKEYEKSLERNNAFDFDDLIEKVVRIFQKYLDVLEKYQDQFKYILVDEYQDTNTSQYYFIKLMAQGHRNLSVVGDDQQSIFKFRGSDFRNFLNFEKDWEKTKIVLLEENYRSTSNIIEAASSVIANNKLQKSKKLWTKNNKGELVKIVEHSNADYEAEWITQQIKMRFRFVADEKQSIAVLYRTNAQSRAIEQSLIEKGIPYFIFGGLRFYDRKEIKDVVAGLRYALNPKDEVSLLRLDKTFVKKIYGKIKEGLPAVSLGLKPTELIGYFLKETDYFEYLKKNYPNYQERIENLGELIEFSSGFNDLGEFMEKISLVQSTDTINRKNLKDHKDKFVSLMSIHLSKGLEFDVVYVIGVNEGLLPHQMSYRSDMEIEEERRLMYVAMTRAKKDLFLNFYDLPSRFLHEIYPEYVEFIGRRSLDLDDEERYIELD